MYSKGQWICWSEAIWYPKTNINILYSTKKTNVMYMVQNRSIVILQVFCFAVLCTTSSMMIWGGEGKDMLRWISVMKFKHFQSMWYWGRVDFHPADILIDLENLALLPGLWWVSLLLTMFVYLFVCFIPVWLFFSFWSRSHLHFGQWPYFFLIFHAFICNVPESGSTYILINNLGKTWRV